MLVALDVGMAIKDSAIRIADKGFLIKGAVTEVNFPIPCRVRLFEKLTGRLIADVATDALGHYEFSNLAKVKFFIVAHHPASQYNAVIQDNVVPK